MNFTRISTSLLIVWFAANPCSARHSKPLYEGTTKGVKIAIFPYIGTLEDKLVNKKTKLWQLRPVRGDKTERMQMSAKNLTSTAMEVNCTVLTELETSPGTWEQKEEHLKMLLYPNGKHFLGPGRSGKFVKILDLSVKPIGSNVSDTTDASNKKQEDIQ